MQRPAHSRCAVSVAVVMITTATGVTDTPGTQKQCAVLCPRRLEAASFLTSSVASTQPRSLDLSANEGWMEG